jgi:hypothetical protein
MPTTTPTILDQISAEKTKVSERLARLDTDRATVATQLTDLETAVSRTPPARRPTSAAAAEQRPLLPTEAAGGRQKQPRGSQQDANPTHRASASASWLWLPARPDRNFTWRAPKIDRTISASQCSAISVPDGSRSATASCMRHRPRHTRQPEPKLGDGHEHVQLRPEECGDVRC